MGAFHHIAIYLYELISSISSVTIFSVVLWSFVECKCPREFGCVGGLGNSLSAARSLVLHGSVHLVLAYGIT